MRLRFPWTARAAVVGAAALVLSACATQPSVESWGTETGDAVNVYSVARVDNLLVIGGNFTQLVSPDGAQRRPAGQIAALDAATGQPVWTGNAGGTVYRVVSDGTSIWAGGDFGVKRFAKSNGAQLPFEEPQNVGAVRALAVGGGTVYYGGATGLAAATTSGSHVWRVSVPSVRTVALAQNGARLLVGGYFCSIGGQNRPGLASVTTSGQVDTSFTAPAFGCGATDTARVPFDMVVSGDRAYVAGAGGLNALVAVNAGTGRTIWRTPAADGDYQTVTLFGTSLYAGGHFSCVKSSNGTCETARQKAAKYDTNGVLDAAWAPDFRGGFNGVWSIRADGGGVYAGGNFTRVNGVERHKVVILK